jgi:hypothetical protein
VCRRGGVEGGVEGGINIDMEDSSRLNQPVPSNSLFNLVHILYQTVSNSLQSFDFLSSIFLCSQQLLVISIPA